MHELFAKVLDEKDLSKAGDLFSLEDQDIVGDISTALKKIGEIIDTEDYIHNDNDQSVVEICITRVTTTIRFLLQNLFKIDPNLKIVEYKLLLLKKKNQMRIPILAKT